MKAKNSNKKSNITKTEPIKKECLSWYEIISLLVSVISVLLTLVLTIYTNSISSKVNEFNQKLAPLNLEIKKYTTPDTLHSKDSDITYTLTPYEIYPTTNEFSGDYSKVIFSFDKDNNVDMFDCSIGEIKNETESGYWSTNGKLIRVTKFDNENLTFNFCDSDMDNIQNKYGIINIIFQSYAQEYHIYTMIYSTLTYDAFILDNIDVNSINLISTIVDEFGLITSTEELQNQIKKSRVAFKEAIIE